MSRIEASVDKNPVGRDESLILTVVADDEVEASRLDTSPLLRNFLVGRTSISRSTRIVNFSSEKETRWQVLLAPRDSGSFTIPAFSIDGVRSNPIEITVSAESEINRDTQYLYVTSELLSPLVYVGQMALYKIKLYLGLDLQRGEISAPELAGAQIKQLGDDKDGSEIVDGRRFRVIERTYGIIPDTAGELEVKAPVFEGDVLVPSPRNGGMFNFNESRPMRVSGESRTLKVLDKPADWQGPWLVADLVALTEEFPDHIEEFTVGTPITRTLSLVATNVDETSLPALEPQLPPELKNYPEKPERSSYLREGQLVSQLKLTQAIVPMEPGTFEIPALQVAWFNPQLGKRQLAVIAPRTIRVTGPAKAEAAALPPQAAEPQGWQWWPWLAAILGLGWALTAIGWAVTARRWKADARLSPAGNSRAGENERGFMQTASKSNAGNVHQKAALAELKRACDGNDGREMLSAVLGYLSLRQGESVTLESAGRLSLPLAAALSQIQRALYGSDAAQQPDGAALYKAIQMLGAEANASASRELKPLNPG
nr:BatD family protein [Shewanella jiangmenensis]